MAYLIATLVATLVCTGFLALTRFEMARGARYGQQSRTRLDEFVGRISFIVAHVDFVAWAKDEARTLGHRVSHAVAHLSLQGIRMLERLLTRAVRHLRTKESLRDAAPRATERPFIGTLAEFKTELSAARTESTNEQQ